MRFLRRREAIDPAIEARYQAAWAVYEDGRQEGGIALLIELLSEHERSAWWFDLGLMHKWRQEWQPSLEANERAAELDPKNTSAYWNGGIAATALHDWPVARQMWASYGLRLPAGDGEVLGSLGPTPVRVDLESGTEVVWCERLDPARALIENVPTPDCARRWHDIVLHDGEPKGERRLGKTWMPVFEEISLWRPSAFPKLRVAVGAAALSEVDALVDRFHATDRGAQDWTGSVQPLCRECSEGRPGSDHEHSVMFDWSTRRDVGLGCEVHVAERLLDEWVREGPERRDRGPVEVV